MLNAFKSQLRALWVENKAEFTGRVKQRSRDKGAAKRTRQLRDFVLVLPEMIEQVRSWTDEPETPSPIKRLHGFMLTYLYHPTDFIADDPDGLFGYLDDAYLVGSIYFRTMSQRDHGTIRYLPNTQDISRQMPLWLKTTRHVLPEETGKIDQMIDELCGGNDASFQRMMGTAG